MKALRLTWIAVAAIFYVPSNLLRGYSLREQYDVARLAMRVEAL